MRIQDSFQASARNVDMSDAPKLTLDEVRQIKSEVSRIILPDAVFETMDKVQEAMASDRRRDWQWEAPDIVGELNSGVPIKPPTPQPQYSEQNETIAA